jgi:hypothetical protein
MVMFEPHLELSDVLGSIGHEDPVSVDVVIEPLPNVFYPIVIFQLIGLNAFKQRTILLRDRLILVVRQP